MSEFPMRPIRRPPLLDDGQDGIDLVGQEPMGRAPTGGQILQQTVGSLAGPPTMHPVIRDIPHAGGPPVREPSIDSVVDSGEDQVFHLGGDSRRDRAVQSQPDFPRTIDNSIA